MLLSILGRRQAIRPVALILSLAILGASPALYAWQEESGYQRPPEEIAKLVDLPAAPVGRPSPNGEWLLVMEPSELPSIGELAEEELRLAGFRIHPRNFAPSRPRGVVVDMFLKRISDGEERSFTGLPEGRKMSVDWSPDSKHIAFAHLGAKTVSLWAVSVADGKARKLTDRPLNAIRGWGVYDWLGDSSAIVATLLSTDVGNPPEAPVVSSGPILQVADGEEAPARTFQDLLKNKYDEDLFAHYMTSQIAMIGLDGKVAEIGKPDLYASVDRSPDDRYLLLEIVRRPFSYLVPAGRFARDIVIWDRSGKPVHEVAKIPLAENIPKGFGAVREGPRSVNWRGDAPATVAWAEARDGGDPNKEVEVREQVYMLAAPFDSKPVLLANCSQRFSGVTWGNGSLALVVEWWWQTRNLKVWKVQPDNPDAAADLMMDRSFEDRYNDPGQPVMTQNEFGQGVLMISKDGKHLFMSGQGASAEGNRPFLDKRRIKDAEVERLWQSEAPHYENIVDVLDPSARRVLVSRQSAKQPANLYLVDRKTGKERRLTSYDNPTPELADIEKELIKYERADGVQLTATLYLPPGYDPETDGRLPVLMWAYPREFKSADAAGQVTDSPYRFSRISYWGPLPFLAMGYAVLEGPTMPIIGEGDAEPNDTYIEQLVASAQAAVDEVVRRGIGDRDRMAIGGHSYGAFMVANLLAHSDLFAAGIARSGAYNRSLTPFGFQAEERTFWEATDIYATMSPFFHADKINEPILFIHGEADNNSGTYPMQSERMFAAVKGLGGVARLVMLPHESHGYRARESLLHMLWEENRWLETHVKNRAEKAVSEAASSGE
jgi:dipeptidyl aminopeptidase/acylaminoacyl peptidase